MTPTNNAASCPQCNAQLNNKINNVAKEVEEGCGVLLTCCFAARTVRHAFSAASVFNIPLDIASDGITTAISLKMAPLFRGVSTYIMKGCYNRIWPLSDQTCEHNFIEDSAQSSPTVIRNLEVENLVVRNNASLENAEVRQLIVGKKAHIFNHLHVDAQSNFDQRVTVANDMNIGGTVSTRRIVSTQAHEDFDTPDAVGLGHEIAIVCDGSRTNPRIGVRCNHAIATVTEQPTSSNTAGSSSLAENSPTVSTAASGMSSVTQQPTSTNTTGQSPLAESSPTVSKAASGMSNTSDTIDATTTQAEIRHDSNEAQSELRQRRALKKESSKMSSSRL